VHVWQHAEHLCVFFKTAAHTYAVAQGRSTLEEEEEGEKEKEEAEPADEQQREMAEDGDHQDTQSAQSAQSPRSPHVRDHLHRNLAHFRKQVTQDFQVAKEDVKATYSFVLGHQDAQTAQEQDGEQRSREQQQLMISPQYLAAAREKLPCVASTTVGVAVAASLLPVRALRLAAASTSAVIASQGNTTSDTRDPILEGQGAVNAR